MHPSAARDNEWLSQANRKLQQAEASRALPAFNAVASAAQQALNRLSPCGLALLHLYAALGYEWGVQVPAACQRLTIASFCLVLKLTSV